MNETFDLEDARPGEADRPVYVRTAAPRRAGQRALWFGVAGITTVVTVGAVGLPQVGWLAAQTDTSAWTARHAITAVEVDVTGGDLTVRPSGVADAVSLRQTLTWTVNKPRVTETWQGDRLLITEDCAAPSIAVVNPCGASLELAVPAGVSVQSTVASGSLVVRRMTGSVTVQAQSGDIELDDDSGTLWARTDSGSVDGNRLKAAQVNAQTLSGDVDLDFAAAPMSVSAAVASGEVNVRVPRGATYRVSGQTDSGDRRIEAAVEDGTSPRQIILDSQSGDVTLGYRGSS